MDEIEWMRRRIVRRLQDDLHTAEWTPYSAEGFHRSTLEHEGLPVLRG